LGANVIVVGAGPAGCAAAIALAQRGVRGVVLIDRSRFPRQKTCGSAVSPLGLRVLTELGVESDVRHRASAIHSLLLTTPGNRRIQLRGGEAALVLLRKEFDQLLVDRARALGVKFIDGVAVTGLVDEEGRIAGVRTGGDEMRARYVVCADGAHSQFSVDARPRRTLATIMGWWENFEYDPGTIEMIFDRTLSPLYGWMFPESSSRSRVNIGIVVDGPRAGATGDLGNLRPVFQSFLDRHFEGRLRTAQPVGRWAGHPISYTTWTSGAARPGALYAGESARLTNAATGEGIYQAMRCGVMAAETLAAVMDGSVEESRAWRDYTRRCRRTFAPGFAMGHAFRAAVRWGVLDAVAIAYAQPRLRRIATWALGSALTASSVSGDRR
jgi:geranylgeranyl reductase family protein